MQSNHIEQGGFLSIMKGILITVIVNLSFVLLFSLVIKISLLGVSVIKWVNQFLKIISVFIGVFFTVKESKGFIKGSAVGLFSSVITFLLFALIGGESASFLSFFLDTLFCLIVGGIVGIMAVNRKTQY